MSLVVLGISHRTCPVETREKLGFSRDSLPHALMHLNAQFQGGGVIVLNTCNRIEIYVHHPLDGHELASRSRSFLSEWHNVPEAEFAPHTYEYHARETAGHLFRVASSLDSLVLGEAQILGQVHEAYLLAQAAQTTDKVLHALFQQAFTVAKHVRSSTNIGAGKVSVSSVAVDLAASIFMDLSGKTVMVVGSGDVAELTLRCLVDRGVKNVLIANRHAERAQALAAAFGGQPVPFDSLRDHLHRADIVIGATAAPRFVLHPEHFQDAMPRRNHAPMFIIDIAVPRDVDPAVGRLDNVYLYNIDDLERVVGENMEARRREIDQCLAVIERETDKFMRWMGGLAAEPAIVSMSEELHAIRERELQKTLTALDDLTPRQREEVAYLTQRIVNAILQRPITQIKHEIGHHDPGTVIHLVKRLFGIEETG
jgi:glutamyl-tRNA reductase